MLIEINLIYLIAATLLSLAIGFFLGKQQNNNTSQISAKNQNEKNKLNQELLQDEVKQLTAKVQTLEKALEMAQKMS